MNTVNLKIKDLKPYEKNAKKHDKTQIDNVAESIKQFGMVQPIVVDKDNVVIIGHCRLEACKKLKYKEVPCVKADELSEEQVAKLRLLDNKLNESDWDFDLISEELLELDLSDFELDWNIADKEKIEKDIEENGEIEFTEIMNEENNYIILQFKTDIDWIQAESLFELKKVKAYSTRTDGKINKGMERVGTERVLDGAKFINKIMESIR